MKASEGPQGEGAIQGDCTFAIGGRFPSLDKNGPLMKPFLVPSCAGDAITAAAKDVQPGRECD